MTLLYRPLTEEEVCILQMVADGYSCHEIAEHLYVTDSAIRNRLWRLKDKLKAQNTPSAIAQALRKGLIK